LGKYIDLPQGGLSSDIILNTRMTSREEDYCWNQPTSVGQHWLVKITILFKKQNTHLWVKLSDAIQLIEPNCACLLISNFLENCSQLLLHSIQPTEIQEMNIWNSLSFDQLQPVGHIVEILSNSSPFHKVENDLLSVEPQQSDLKEMNLRWLLQTTVSGQQFPTSTRSHTIVHPVLKN